MFLIVPAIGSQSRTKKLTLDRSSSLLNDMFSNMRVMISMLSKFIRIIRSRKHIGVSLMYTESHSHSACNSRYLRPLQTCTFTSNLLDLHTFLYFFKIVFFSRKNYLMMLVKAKQCNRHKETVIFITIRNIHCLMKRMEQILTKERLDFRQINCQYEHFHFIDRNQQKLNLSDFKEDHPWTIWLWV